MPRGIAIDGKRLESLLAYGMSVKDIAQEMGINTFSIYRYLRNAKKQPKEESMPFTDLDTMADMKHLENSGKLNGRKIDGTPIPRAESAEKSYPLFCEPAPTEEPAPTPVEEPTSTAPRLTEEDTVRTLTGKRWVYVISSRDKTVTCRPRVGTDEYPCKGKITLGLSDATELALDLLGIVGGYAR